MQYFDGFIWWKHFFLGKKFNQIQKVRGRNVKRSEKDKVKGKKEREGMGGGQGEWRRRRRRKRRMRRRREKERPGRREHANAGWRRDEAG